MQLDCDYGLHRLSGNAGLDECTHTEQLNIKQGRECLKKLWNARPGMNKSTTLKYHIHTSICICVTVCICKNYINKNGLLSQTQKIEYQFSSVQSLSHVQLFATSWIAARQASLSITNSWSQTKPMSIKSVMPSSHLILCRPLLLLPPIPPSISLFQWVNSSHQVAKVLEFQL